MSFIEDLQWRYATKRFDTHSALNQQQIARLIKAINLTPTSYGLQPFKVLVISNGTLKKHLQEFSWDQPQITECSHLFVFCNQTAYNDALIDDYIHLKSKEHHIDLQDLKGYGDFMKSKVGTLSQEHFQAWATNQSYLALGYLLMGCASDRIDACPMEGFVAERYNDILKLNEQGLNASVIATVGYRATEDETQHQPKVRKPVERLFKFHK